MLLTFVFKTAFSKCRTSGIHFYPEQKEISLNAMSIIERCYSSQETINSYRACAFYFKSTNGALIELNIQEILKDQRSLTQAIFNIFNTTKI